MTPDFPTASMEAVAGHPAEAVAPQPGVIDPNADPMDAWYALVGRPQGAGPVPA